MFINDNNILSVHMKNLSAEIRELSADLEKRKSRPGRYSTHVLYAFPDFIKGLGSMFNIFGGYYEYNSEPSALKADEKAIRNDWGVVGDDLLRAIEEYQIILKENREKLDELDKRIKALEEKKNHSL